ncbi:MAG: ferredoxin--NADP reductase [Candidatus Limnocylindrales bacterium]
MTSEVTWPVFEAPLTRRVPVAERTMAFSFARQADWGYRAGQFIDITLHDPPETDAEGDTRGFSISSAPCEDVITITTRLRETAFKRSLQQVPLGTPAKLEGPFGDLRLHHAKRPAVVLTGGIGITPFRSILVEAIRSGDGLAYPVTILCANHRPGDAPYLAEIQALAAAEPQLTVVPTMTALAQGEGSWSGERGRIDAAMLARHVPSSPAPIYYVTGPVGMVQGLRAMLVAAEVEEDDIRTEEFTGY